MHLYPLGQGMFATPPQNFPSAEPDLLLKNKPTAIPIPKTTAPPTIQIKTRPLGFNIGTSTGIAGETTGFSDSIGSTESTPQV